MTGSIIDARVEGLLVRIAGLGLALISLTLGDKANAHAATSEVRSRESNRS